MDVERYIKDKKTAHEMFVRNDIVGLTQTTEYRLTKTRESDVRPIEYM